MQPLRLDKSELFQYRVTLLPASHGRRHHSVLSYQGCRHDQHGRAQPSWWDRGGLDPYSKTWGDSSYILSLGTTSASRNRKSEHWGDHPSLWMPVPSHHCGPEKEVRPQFFCLWADWRRKRRRIIVDDTAPVRAAGTCLSEDDYLSSFEGEIRRQDCFNFHGIAPSGLLLLEQGQFVMLQRLGDLRWKICNYWYDFFKSISSSFHDFGSHQFIKDSALLLLNPLRDQSIFYFISSPFRNLTLTRHITSVYYQTIPKRMWFWLTGEKTITRSTV